jgi:23S rRNA (adenine2503-C2)-methyltransferase
MNAKPIDLRELSKEEVTALVAELGEKPYRAKQVWEWLWKTHASSIGAMNNLSKEFRARLEERAVLRPLAIAEQQKSSDGTVKCALRTWDGHVVEAVLIPTEKRITACISSQIGLQPGLRLLRHGQAEAHPQPQRRRDRGPGGAHRPPVP